MRKFDYSLDYKNLDLRRQPELYHTGKGEQGVLLVEPYKSEILPHWKFRKPAEAEASAAATGGRCGEDGQRGDLLRGLAGSEEGQGLLHDAGGAPGGGVAQSPF